MLRVSSIFKKAESAVAEQAPVEAQPVTGSQIKQMVAKAAHDTYEAPPKDPTDNAALMAWFGNSIVRDPQGKPQKVFHGSTHTFDKFDASKSNPEGYYGKAIYFTNSPEDAGENYGTEEGPDLRVRLEQRVEQIMNDLEDQFGYGTPEYKKLQAECLAQAKRELVGTSQGHVYVTYLRILKPVIVKPSGGTYFEGMVYNEREDDYKESRQQSRLFAALQRAIAEAGGSQRDWQSLMEGFGDMTFEGFTAYQFEQVVRNSDVVYDLEGGGPGSLISRVYQLMGFDGIVQDAASEFTNMKLGPGTTHYIVWNPRQVKSALSNSGKYNPRSPRMTAKVAGQGPYGPGTEGWTREDYIKDWVTRHKLPLDEQGRARFFHATPNRLAPTIVAEGLKDHSFLATDAQTAISQVGSPMSSDAKRALKPHQITCFEVWVPLDAFKTSYWAITSRPLSPIELNLKKVA